jgi:hypothetical protein
VKKKKTVKKGDKNWASITMQINENRFHAEGDNAEVQAKFKIWLDEQFAPMRKRISVPEITNRQVIRVRELTKLSEEQCSTELILEMLKNNYASGVAAKLLCQEACCQAEVTAAQFTLRTALQRQSVTEQNRDRAKPQQNPNKDPT